MHELPRFFRITCQLINFQKEDPALKCCNRDMLNRFRKNGSCFARRRAFFLCLALAIPHLVFAQSYNIYYGDLHSHSIYSWDAKAGAKAPAAAYAYAKHVAGLDFLAISDHTNGFSQTKYELVKAAADLYLAPESAFVAIAGQELGSLGSRGYGHMNIFETPTIAGTGADDDDVRYNLNMAYNFVINNKGMAQFNHPTTENGNSNFNNLAYFQAADVYVHSLELVNGRRSENYERYYLLALANGWHVGAIGDQDNHAGNYGDRPSSDGSIYLTGVLAAELTKEAMLGAIAARRTYALEAKPTNDRLRLTRFTADGHWIGETFDDADNTVVLRVAASSPAGRPFRQVQIYKNGQLLAFLPVGAAEFDWTVVDSASTGRHYYFAKAMQEDGDKLWTSPIWVNSPGAAAPERIFSISELRAIDANGMPVSLGWAGVKVRGVATAGGHFGASGPGFLQDSTGGIAVFGGDYARFVGFNVAPNAFEVEVVGEISFYNGLTELHPYFVKRVGISAPVQPRPLTTGKLAAEGESYEGQLVVIRNARINGQFPAAGRNLNMTIDDGSGPCTMRIDKDTNIPGTATPAGTVDITGVVGQFDSSPPYTSGYQLLPRSRDDFNVTTGIKEDMAAGAARQFELQQNYPNPFNAGTRMTFTLPEAARVELAIYTLRGRRVATLLDAHREAGVYHLSWNGVDAAGAAVASGIYVLQMRAGNFRMTRKLILLR